VRRGAGIVAAVVIVLAAIVGWAADPTYRVVDFAALTALLDAPTPGLLIDARAAESYNEAHIPLAVNIPGYLFDKDELPKGLPPERDQPLAIYCAGGHCGISVYVAERLLDFGYRHVLVYEEGVQGWVARGQQLISRRHERLPQIKKDDLGAVLATGAPVRLIDARSATEFAVKTIPGAQSLTVEKCRADAAALPPSRDGSVIVFGQSQWDGRPYHVAECLRDLGYRKVQLYAPGLRGWPPR
jgi:rhodanese-related sulfurtransferase